MSQIHAEGKITRATGAALAAYRRVKNTAGTLSYCSNTEVGDGTLLNETFANSNKASGFDDGTVILWTNGDTRKYVAADSITEGNSIYAAANGKVSASGSVIVGRALEDAVADDIFEGYSIGNANVATDVGGTTATAFLVDSDSSTPRIELASQPGGTGNFKTTLKPETTLSGDNVIIVPEANGDTLAAVALAQTLTNKTLTSPVINTPTVKDLTEVVAATNVITAAETGSVFFLNHATEFVSTLPAPAAGLKFTFVVTAAPSGASYTVVTNGSDNILKGLIVTCQDAGGTSDSEISGADTISFVDGKAVTGDRVDVICDGTNWFAYGTCKVFDGITITTAS